MRVLQMMTTTAQCAGALALAILLGGTSTASAQAPGPCREILAACQQAGFVPGGGRAGEGIQVDCIRPIMQGRAQPRRATKPLPQVDPGLVAACRATNPNFGLGNNPDAVEPPGPPPQQPRVMAPPLPEGGKRPNFVFVLADDFSTDLVQYMPNLQQMEKDGASFTNYFVTDSLCCPSRSSIFTGRYPHNTGIFTNEGDDGGYDAFVGRGHERTTFAVALSAAGYRTAMLGKYLNGYRPRRDQAGPGWNLWSVAGNGYPGFNYDLNENGNVAHYANRPADYLTDVVSAQAVSFIKQASSAPFMIEIATFAPHSPYTPAPRDANAFPDLRAPRSAAFDVAPDPTMPRWILSHRPLSPADVALIDGDYRKRAQSVLAIDAMIAALHKAVAEIGAADNTYFVFSSDNGYHMGEHRMMPGKMTAFDTDIRVPLIVTGPGIQPGARIKEIAQNIDLCPTFAELGFARPPQHVDGRSLVPLLHGEPVEGWRTVALIEHHGKMRSLSDPDWAGPRGGNPISYEAIRMAAALYVEYADGEKEFHDLITDPQELHNTFAALASARKAALHASLESVKNCRDAGCQSAERRVESALHN